MNIFIGLIYFLTVKGQLYATTTEATSAFTKSEVCIEARERHAEVWLVGLQFNWDSEKGEIVRRRVDCRAGVQ